MANSQTQRVQTTATAKGAQGPIPTGTAAKRYEAGAAIREPYLIRARRLSALTVPNLFRDQSANGSDDTETTWSSFGAYGVNNLGAKLIIALFPPGQAFIKMKMARSAEKDLQALGDPDTIGKAKASIDAGFSVVEQDMVECMDEDGDRANLTEAANKLLVGGNHGFQFYPDGSQRGISLDDFVTWRNPKGQVIEFVVKDVLSWNDLEDDIQTIVRMRGFDPEKQDTGIANFPVFTHGRICCGKWLVYQEIYGCQVPDSMQMYVADAMPFLFVPFKMLSKEHYGRAYVEDYEGDIQTLEGNTQSITEAGAAIARFITLVSPTGLTSKKAVSQARNGDVITGRAEDVATYQANIGRDMQSVMAISQDVTQRLSRAFMLLTPAIRNAERVTQEEIRQVASELEQQLGGAYSTAVVQWQAPWARLKLRYLQVSGRLVSLPAGSTKTSVVAGMAALGRNAQLSALDQFIAGATAVVGPQEVAKRVDVSTYLTKRAAALGIDQGGLIKPEAQVQQETQQAMAMQTAQNLAPEAVRQLGQNQQANTNAQAKVDVANTPDPNQSQPDEGSPADDL